MNSFSNTLLELTCVLICFHERNINGYATPWNWPPLSWPNQKVWCAYEHCHVLEGMCEYGDSRYRVGTCVLPTVLAYEEMRVL